MITRSTLVASLLALVVSCQSQVHDHTPADAEDTPCEGTDCPAAGEQPPAESGGAEPTDGSVDTSPGAGDPPAQPACSALEQSDCAASERCVPITDFKGEYRGCGPRDVGCKEVETCASNGEVTTMFPDSCIPEGYKERSPAACEGAGE